MIEIEPYRNEWVEDYRSVASAIRAQLKGSECYLHHIGSTAVPKLASKSVIDIQITVKDFDAEPEKAIEALGFELRRHCHDHDPIGTNFASKQLEKRVYKNAHRRAIVHVRELGRYNQRYAILFRDFLRSNSVAARAYEKVKIELAERFADDAASYYAVKNPVFDLIMLSAEGWAKGTQWVLPPED
jgi:GrpB-like predicted nucleotidyltransferase (UPF0157 family)